MLPLEENYKKIREQIQAAIQRTGRSHEEVKLLAVCKGQTAPAVLELIRLGQRDLGENYVQEWKRKKLEVEEKVRWHFTGRLQTNKVKELVGEITLFHSIDRIALAEKLDQVANLKGLTAAGLVEVDLAHESSKTGVGEKDLESFLTRLNNLSHLQITGLMILPPVSEDQESSRPYFRRLREILFDLNRKSIYRSPLTELSMGMSQDYRVAIEEGATWIRIGRALFQ